MWTEQDDKEIRYGRWHHYNTKTTRAEEDKVHPPKAVEEIWPDWSEGVPTKLRRRVFSPWFSSQTGVRHYPYERYASLELKWSNMYIVVSTKRKLPPFTRELPE